MTLFRPAALSTRDTQWLGKIVVVQPLSLSALSWAAVAMALGVGGFLFNASYTERTTVTGRLMPRAGLVSVFVPQSGIVARRLVSEGQAVREATLCMCCPASGATPPWVIPRPASAGNSLCGANRCRK